eukprot:CAMPEP_0172152844 /NCGR_PEP_ID=MMETSP1050-20130122/1084_1 /TAXON_ID=233186 /ORGANISM="Cryptomonas curvata, Strain CCAP979/52" /LENGTH=439 /DNA_ID=CAMNT_0012821253 /DNA_START=150 /DNA_END=1470 /DNA_ORIENTATION=+
MAQALTAGAREDSAPLARGARGFARGVAAGDVTGDPARGSGTGPGEEERAGWAHGEEGLGGDLCARGEGDAEALHQRRENHAQLEHGQVLPDTVPPAGRERQEQPAQGVRGGRVLPPLRHELVGPLDARPVDHKEGQQRLRPARHRELPGRQVALHHPARPERRHGPQPHRLLDHAPQANQPPQPLRAPRPPARIRRVQLRQQPLLHGRVAGELHEGPGEGVARGVVPRHQHRHHICRPVVLAGVRRPQQVRDDGRVLLPAGRMRRAVVPQQVLGDAQQVAAGAARVVHVGAPEVPLAQGEVHDVVELLDAQLHVLQDPLPHRLLALPARPERLERAAVDAEHGGEDEVHAQVHHQLRDVHRRAGGREFAQHLKELVQLGLEHGELLEEVLCGEAWRHCFPCREPVAGSLSISLLGEHGLDSYSQVLEFCIIVGLVCTA